MINGHQQVKVLLMPIYCLFDTVDYEAVLFLSVRRFLEVKGARIMPRRSRLREVI